MRILGIDAVPGMNCQLVISQFHKPICKAARITSQSDLIPSLFVLHYVVPNLSARQGAPTRLRAFR